uniref:FAR1 domain-containing protein n=1 Tax=Mesocestoides corti TaxID=53468 RepID=A0A5K3ET51_MESCO
MDTNDCFLNALSPLYFTSFEELKKKMKEFEISSGVQYAIKRSIRLADDIPNKDVFVYKYIQYVCGCQKLNNCQSFVNICHSYGTLRIVRFWMIHSHSVSSHIGDSYFGHGKNDGIFSNPMLVELPEADDDDDMATDQTSVFQEHVPLKSFSSFAELERLLLAFQQSTGCLLVKRNSIRYPDSSPEHETLVYKSITYACCHYGSGRSLPSKSQQQKTRKMNCPCVIRVGCRGKKLHIIGFVMRHNHPVTTELAETYPENRRLTEDEKLEITDFLQSAPDNLTVKEHIERKFGKPCTLNDVRQMKYRLRKLQKTSSANHESVKFDPSRHDDQEAEFELEPVTEVPDWAVQSKDQRLSQFEPFSHQLTDLVCSADPDVFCERLNFIKELTQAWRSGKQPMLTYSESMLKSESCESPVDTEVVTSDPPFPYTRPSKTYMPFTY